MGGVLLAVSSTLAFAGTDVLCSLPLTVDIADVNIVATDPRFIIVRISAPRLSILCAVIHGLDSGYKLPQVIVHWDMVYRILRSVRIAD